jgi:hypothetical protein
MDESIGAYNLLKFMVFAVGLLTLFLQINHARKDPLIWAKIAFSVIWLGNVLTFAVVTWYIRNYSGMTPDLIDIINMWSSSIQLHGIISVLGSYAVLLWIRRQGLE